MHVSVHPRRRLQFGTAGEQKGDQLLVKSSGRVLLTRAHVSFAHVHARTQQQPHTADRHTRALPRHDTPTEARMLPHPATALAKRVFPVPGGPSRMTPRGMTAPSWVKRCGSLRNWTTSSSSRLAPSTPITSGKRARRSGFGKGLLRFGGSALIDQLKATGPGAYAPFTE